MKGAAILDASRKTRGERGGGSWIVNPAPPSSLGKRSGEPSGPTAFADLDTVGGNVVVNLRDPLRLPYQCMGGNVVVNLRDPLRLLTNLEGYGRYLLCMDFYAVMVAASSVDDVGSYAQCTT